MTTWLPRQFSGSDPGYTGSTGRLLQTVLPTAFTDSSSCFLTSLYYVITRMLLFIGALFVVYIFVLLETFVRPRKVSVDLALKEQAAAMNLIVKGRTVESQRHLLNALAYLGKPFPDSVPAQMVFVISCHLRAIMGKENRRG
jgi:hypothetical protein